LRTLVEVEAEAEARTEALARVCARLRGALRARALLRDHGSGPLEEVEPSPADPGVLAEVESRMRLPALYVEYLRRHHAKAFEWDFVLGWHGVALMLVGADGLEEATGSYAQDDWPESWVVIGFEYEGCYFIDVDTGRVRYLDHGVGLHYQQAGRDFVDFLEQVIEASLPEVESEAHRAIAAHDRTRLEAVLRAGGEREPRTLTLLGAAVLHGAVQIVEHLLERGADAEAMNPATKCTALGIAIGTGQRGLMLRLLEHGASPEATDDRGRTVLTWATRRGDEELVAAALRAGATPLPEGWLEEQEAAEARARTASHASSGEPGPAPTKPRVTLPAELYAVGVGVVIAIAIVVIVLVLAWLGWLE
jgi:hypothetical protein